MKSMLVTLSVAKFTGWLKVVAPENMRLVVVTPCEFEKVIGWFKLLALSNMEASEVTLVKLQFNGELKLVFMNIPASVAPDKNTGCVEGGADTCRFTHPANTLLEVLSITKLSPQLTISINFAALPPELKRNPVTTPAIDTLYEPGRLYTWVAAMELVTASICPSPQVMFTLERGIVKGKVMFSFGAVVFHTVRNGRLLTACTTNAPGESHMKKSSWGEKEKRKREKKEKEIRTTRICEHSR